MNGYTLKEQCEIAFRNGADKLPAIVYWKDHGPGCLKFTAAWVSRSDPIDCIAYKIFRICDTMAEARRDVERLNPAWEETMEKKNGIL